MDQIMIQFDKIVAAPDGRTFVARAWARQAEDGKWLGWTEFDPRDGTPSLRAPAHTEMISRDDVEEWARSIQDGELQLAFDDAWAQPHSVEVAPEAPERARPRAALDPLSAFTRGESALREHLADASEWQLRAIIRGNHWIEGLNIDLENIGRPVLEEMIVAAVRRRRDPTVAGRP